MKVKVTNGDFWYKDKVGEVFEVTEHSKCYDGELWKVVNPVNSIETGLYKKDCEDVKEMAKFNIGDTVKVLECGEHRGKIGEITEARTGSFVMYPWNVKFDNGESEIYKDSEIELVEPQWMDKATALKLCIDGAKIVDEGSAHPMSYVDFNGTDFGYHCYGESKRSSIKYLGERWKLWTPPTPPKPKFAVNDFVIASDDQSYMKITAVGDYDDGYTYECTGYADESGDVFIEEHRLTKA